MASKAQIQTVKADFLDPSLYDDPGLSGLPRLSRGALLTALSRAFDLAEGRRPGHAQRVAYVGVYLASELDLDAKSLEDVFFGCLLHDAGMAGATHGPRLDPARGTRFLSSSVRAVDLLPAAGSGGWSDVIEALAAHCELGATIARKLGLGEGVARAV